MSEAVATAEAPTNDKPAKPRKAKKAAKTGRNGKKSGLRKPQIAILAYLARQKNGSSRSKIKAATGADISGSIGCQDPTEREALEKKNGYPSLLTLGYIRLNEIVVEDGMAPERRYDITANGRKALTKGG